ncbi:MAG: LuxR C-terminal-related transcriptional regulator [Polyangiaceae bacterium]
MTSLRAYDQELTSAPKLRANRISHMRLARTAAPVPAVALVPVAQLAALRDGDGAHPAPAARALAANDAAAEDRSIDGTELGAPALQAAPSAPHRSKPLSERQQQVIDMAARGIPQKVIAYELGIAASTVGTHLRLALDRLHIERPQIALTVAASSGSVRPAPTDDGALPVPATLSPAEADVVRAIIRGATNEQIAIERSRSIRTIANQVASAFRKLGIGSRGELYRRAVEWLAAGQRVATV